MSSRITILTLIVTILSMLIAYGQWQYPKQKSITTSTKIKNHSSPELIISGMNIEVFIKEGSRTYKGGEIKGMNQKSTIYIPKSQYVIIKVNGSNIELIIEEKLVDSISIIKNGSNINIIEL